MLVTFCNIVLMLGVDPASKLKGSISVIFDIVKFNYRFITIVKMTFTLQNGCDKIVDGKMALYREFCFPNCTKSWSTKLLSLVLGAEIAPVARWTRPCLMPLFSFLSFTSAVAHTLYIGMPFLHCFFVVFFLLVLPDIDSMHFVTFSLLVKRLQLKIGLGYQQGLLRS